MAIMPCQYFRNQTPDDSGWERQGRSDVVVEEVHAMYEAVSAHDRD